MYKAKRTNNYPPYKGDSDSDDYYNGDARVLFNYPQQRRMIRIVPIRTSPKQRDDRIIKGYNAHGRKEQERDRIMYPSSRSVRRVNLKTESETESSCDYYRDNAHNKVKVIRLKPRGKRIITTFNLNRKKESEKQSYVSPSLRFITRVHSRSGSETESSTDYSDSTSITHTKVRAKRSKRSERFSNSSQIGKPSENYAKRNEDSENVSSSNEHTVDMVGTRHNHHVKQRKESFPRTGVYGDHLHRNNISHQTKLSINKNTGLTFIRPYDEVCGKNEMTENIGASTNLINRKGTFKSDSYTKFSESSESDRSDRITTDSSQNQHSVIYNIKSTRLNQTKCVLVDYSKLLKYRDSIVKPLPRNTKVKNTLEETYNIKEKLRIDSEMKKRAERRSQLEVWT
ncbi:unnamed protein product [Mytilus coruscus]|uniref:Uncharacterized protein n=1 Tax=Mytilus coruscus TaxID=42192 RepID=A0A6J8CTK2_MYTCO|nr:unnamed protein product [Mytilus coruscus]